jgi:DEAD/DEAH box helicase domain-containing protein
LTRDSRDKKDIGVDAACAALQGVAGHGQIRESRDLPPREARTAALPAGVHDAVRRYLDSLGIGSLYTHQTQTVDAVMEGRDVILATATASGKTLAFTVPVLDALARDHEATALFLYPLKALTQDQLAVLRGAEAATGLAIDPEVYDGDTPRVRRPRIRQLSRAVLTNPYEIHEILPYHHLWRRFYSNLRFVVLDEAHRYTGVFGSHVAQVLRRLLRVAEAYGSRPRILLASASIANPGPHAEALTSRPCTVVDDDGAPAGPRRVILFDAAIEGAGSAHVQTRDVFGRLVGLGLKTLCFTRSRRSAELVASLSLDGPAGPLPVAPYRAGYLPEERRRLEQGFKDGSIRGVVSTPALELGIDIGDLDAVVVSGYPGSVSGFWQQVGRAGRRGRFALAVFVAFQDILDQYVLRNPAVLFDKSFERATVDLKNEHILAGHMLCAASELPVVVQDGSEPEASVARGLAGSGLLRPTDMGLIYAGTVRPQEAVKLDRIGDARVVLVDAEDGEVLETLDLDRALREVFPGAVYLHGARTWVVESLDLEGGTARLRRRDVNHHTQALEDRTADVVDTRDSRSLGTVRINAGRIRMTHRVTRYLIKRYGRVVGGAPLDLPERTFETSAFWMDLAAGTRPGVTDFLGALHALEHTMVGIAPLALSCDPDDLAGFSILMARHSGAPALFIYDGYAGGIGLSDRAYQDLEGLLSLARDVLARCPCETGCPACCLSPRCGSDNQPMDKAGAMVLAGEMLG